MQIYKELGYDAMIEMLVSMPMSLPHQMTMDLLPLTGIEEFGAPPEQQQQQKS